MIVYAVLPQIVPPFISYLIYQWDINIRMATIIGFAGGGGIGLTLTTFFGSLQYHKAGNRRGLHCGRRGLDGFRQRKIKAIPGVISNSLAKVAW